MKISKLIYATVCSVTLGVVGSFLSCASGRSSVGGELTGARLSSWNEPQPYGMIQIPRGTIVLGSKDSTDSIWGSPSITRAISVDAFWMDRTEITNAQYRQFVYYVRDSIIRERLADPAYAGLSEFKITEDRYGDPVTPHLDWSKPIPSGKRASESELEAINSVYYTNPVTRERKLDANQMLYRYEVYDYRSAALRKHQLDAAKRNLNTDIKPNLDEQVLVSKDTAYIDDAGKVISETITRPLSSEYDFLNTYIVPIYPDETCWINDFPNAQNDTYMKLYFNHPGYDDYPVVGISWEQALAFCAWRSASFRQGLDLPAGQVIEDFRLPTEAEWEYAARTGNSNNKYPWSTDDLRSGKGCFLGNFKPGEGDYTSDGHLITSRVGSYSPNDFGLYDMAGNVAEWTSSVFTESGLMQFNDINPELSYTADLQDPYILKRKVVRGGSWKDVARFIRSTTRSSEYQNVPRSYIGFRCVRTTVAFK
ncbi:GldJ [Porphyromonas crevioricanis JCM 15906]|uniref:Serine/threonine-protein kinase pkn1 n=2 Tax=Porphyromonas crevioricanis TaxID=393921 RepID=A0A2X4SH61_9PORP|nr:SUMF1/EgtB/PvdO family nonheme iron enzyme [Porphyromonas crevioricanis]GAD06320.1 GldJ [Porphyromonas crevioricanis JCM 15906]GAD06707.1 GldJ [Porphyromonas crevioricanis JCM 13913]SJZ55468.1 gliding motility-associated lipoprotein GldK [Porphyromonas crevioricanis]SQH73322.1 Serine/threonine-protein kinase pkn1 [Porphyromonas crevioricanis]